MSLFNKFKSITQYHKNTQNSPNSPNRGKEYSFENIGNIEHEVFKDTFKKVGRYQSKEHLHEDLLKYPRLVPCPMNNYH